MHGEAKKERKKEGRRDDRSLLEFPEQLEVVNPAPAPRTLCVLRYELLTTLFSLSHCFTVHSHRSKWHSKYEMTTAPITVPYRALLILAVTESTHST